MATQYSMLDYNRVLIQANERDGFILTLWREKMNKPSKNKISKATFAAGCFWGVEAAFAEIPGVISTQVGYTGGKTKKPTYEKVCTDTTGHAEAVEVTFDPEKVLYTKLLDIFWQCHDPTQMNAQGPDEGSQYRSAIFYHSKKQQEEAVNSKQEWQKKLSKPIVTEITKAGTVYRAEEYHQQYFKKNKGVMCHV